MKRVRQVCKTCNSIFMAQAHWVEKGNGHYCSHKCAPIWNKGLKGVQKANKTSFKKGQTAWNKGKPNTWYNPKGLEVGRGYFKGKHQPKISGENHWNWQGGITKERDKRTKLLEYKLWRKAVYERDNYICVKCGDNTSGNLEADHIKPWAIYPELRYAIDNGQTLCKSCHQKKNKVDRKVYFGYKFKNIN